jgi:hypothetical protein
MEHSGSWESDNQLAGQEILSVFVNPKFCAMFRGSSDWNLPRVSWIQSTSFYSIPLTRILILYSLPHPSPLSAILHVFPIQCLRSHCPSLDYHHNIWWQVKIMTLLIKYNFLYHFVYFFCRHNNFLVDLFSKVLSLCSTLWTKDNVSFNTKWDAKS